MRFSISRFLPRSTFGRGVASLTTGTVIGQLLLLAASPVVTRLYSAEDFGVFGVFVSLVSILSVVSSLRYQIAIPIPVPQTKMPRSALPSATARATRPCSAT